MSKLINNKKLCGTVIVDKPAGMSSTALVTCLRRKLNTKKIGHTGILDRQASGLMLLLVGPATSLAQFFLHADKQYIADFHFGTSTDTHDKEGNIIEQVSEEAVEEFLTTKRKAITDIVTHWQQLTMQKPPIYSAIKRQGKRLSDHIRAGQTIEEPKPRSIRIYKSELLNYDTKIGIRVYLHVSGGTYVRSLARDLGEELGIPVHLGALHRTAVANHQLGDTAWQPEKNTPYISSVQETMTSWPRLTVRQTFNIEKIKRGIVLPIQILEGQLPTKIHQNFFIEDSDGRAIAWAVRITGSYRYKKLLC